MGVPFILFYYYSETTRSAFFARGTRRRVCGSVDSINDSMCQQEYRRWLGSIDTCLRIQRHVHNAHLYTTRLDTTSSLGTSALRSSHSQPSCVPCRAVITHFWSLIILDSQTLQVHPGLDTYVMLAWMAWPFLSQINQWWTKKFLRRKPQTVFLFPSLDRGKLNIS